MSTSLLVVAAGAAVATAGTAVLAARCARTPRIFLAGWTLATFATAIALGAQLVGAVHGYSPLIFRAMELGGQLVAPAALCLGLAELVATSVAARFGVRLLLAAITIVAAVILAIDPLSTAASFSKAWPNPLVFYQVPPTVVICFAIAPVAVLTALAAVVVAGLRSCSGAGAGARLSAAALAAAAVLALAVPGIIKAYDGYRAGLGKGFASPAPYDHLLFVAGCVLAAGLTSGAGLLAARAGTAPRKRSRSGDDGDWGRYDGDGFGAAGVPATLAASGSGPYSGSRLYRPEADRPAAAHQGPGPGQPRWDAADDAAEPAAGYRGGHSRAAGRDDDSGEAAWQPSASSGPGSRGWDGADPLATGGRAWPAGQDARPPAGAGHGRPGYDGDGYAGGDDARTARNRGAGYDGGQYLAAALDPDRSYPGAGTGSNGAAAGPGNGSRPPGGGQPQLFGQLAIYTLIADRADDFDQLTERIVSQVRSNEPGTLVYIAHAVPTAPLQRILYEVYCDRAAYEEHRRQPYMARFEADRRALVVATNVIELGLQQAIVSALPPVSDVLQRAGIDPADVTGPMPRDLVGPPRGPSRPAAAAGYWPESPGRAGQYGDDSGRYR